MSNATLTKSLRVLIVEDDTFVGMGIRAQLLRLGHTVVGQAANAAQTHALYASEKPDLVLMDIKLADVDGIELSKELMQVFRRPVVILSAYSEKELIDRAAVAGVFGYLIKPASDRHLEAQIEVAFSRSAEHETLRAEREKLSSDLETRKLMDRAKGILMKRANLPEGEAHRRLQQESQNRRIPMPDLCRKIIESDEVMGG